ncbi:MAG: rod shape-determining protein MreC [Bacilli bacterium]|nr:rod shape-determining protein MreC [Bacilli bacterium]
MNKRRNRNKKYWLILIFLSIIIVIGVIYKMVNDDRNLTKIESLLKDTGLFVNKVFYSPIKFIDKLATEQKEKKEMYEKYSELKDKSDNYDLLQSKFNELDYQYTELQKTLDLNKTLSKDSYLNATVINRNIGVWYNTITIDKGLKNGVKEDMPVIVKEGLIGKVIKVSNFNSTIKLLTSDDITEKISVKIKNNDDYIFGLLVNYDLDNDVFIIEGIDQNVSIEPGSVVTTTGLGDYFTSGITVGKVKQVKTDNFDLAKIVEVTSDVDFSKLNYVTILKREVLEQ